jgi:hypothetical protein
MKCPQRLQPNGSWPRHKGREPGAHWRRTLEELNRAGRVGASRKGPPSRVLTPRGTLLTSASDELSVKGTKQICSHPSRGVAEAATAFEANDPTNTRFFQVVRPYQLSIGDLDSLAVGPTFVTISASRRRERLRTPSWSCPKTAGPATARERGVGGSPKKKRSLAGEPSMSLSLS